MRDSIFFGSAAGHSLSQADDSGQRTHSRVTDSNLRPVRSTSCGGHVLGREGHRGPDVAALLLLPLALLASGPSSAVMASSTKAHGIQRNSFDELGYEGVGRIFSFLPPISLAYCSAVCASWHDLVASSPNLWRSAYFLEHRRLNRRRRVPTVPPSPAVEKETQNEEEGDVGDEDFRTRCIKEEQRTRLAEGPASVYSWRGHSGRVNCCRMVMGQVVSGSSDGTIKEWSAGRTGQLKCNVTYRVPGKAPVIRVEFDENKVMGAAGKHVFVWSRTGSRRALKRIGGQVEISSMCVADSALVMGCIDGTVRVFDVYSSRCTQLFRKHTEPVKGVVMDMATQVMASGSTDGTVQLFDARSGLKIASLLMPPSPSGISCLQSCLSGQKLFAGCIGGMLSCFDLRNNKTVWKIRVGRPVTCLDCPAYSSSAIGVGGIDGAIKVYDVDSAKRIASFQVKPPRLPTSPVLGLALGVSTIISCHADWNLVQWQLDESNSRVEEDQFGRLVALTIAAAI